jgi:hypothetical protein
MPSLIACSRIAKAANRALQTLAAQNIALKEMRIAEVGERPTASIKRCKDADLRADAKQSRYLRRRGLLYHNDLPLRVNGTVGFDGSVITLTCK